MVKLIKPFIDSNFVIFFKSPYAYWGTTIRLVRRDEPTKLFYTPAIKNGKLFYLHYLTAASWMSNMDKIKFFSSTNFKKHYNYIKKHKEEIIKKIKEIEKTLYTTIVVTDWLTCKLIK